MRFTQVLLKRKPNLRRIYSEKWKEQGKMPIAPVVIPPELKEMGVEIHDAKKLFLQESNAEKMPPKMPDLFSILKSADNAQKFYVFDDSIRVTESENQIGALTKSLCYEGLPHPLDSLIGAESLRNQEQLVKNVAMQALVRDGQMVRLPNVYDNFEPYRRHPRPYGIEYKRKSYNLMEKIAFLAEMGCGKYDKSVKRKKIIDAYIELPMERAGDKVVFQLLSDFLFTCDQPLAPFASPEEVESTKDVELPSIYPIKPTLDLNQLENDPLEHIANNTSGAIIPKNLHIHTLHMVHKDDTDWFPVQKLSKAIASCFSFAAEEARRLYGKDVKEIPRPISLQCIFSDAKTFGFVAYQLNTLDLEDDNGIKNLAWYDGPHDLYEDIDGIKGVQGYNNEIFSTVLALYMNGVHPLSFSFR